ncbi:MAG: hypothetical protein J1F17_04450 [Oscillospiraceae bacterium]|nr:hypothetical protein [Oscillospiraceae bacterium]
MRKNHQEIKEEIFRRSDEYFKKRAVTRKKLLHTSIPVFVCLVITALIAIPNLPMFKNYSDNDRIANKEVEYTESITVEPTDIMGAAGSSDGRISKNNNKIDNNSTLYDIPDIVAGESKNDTNQSQNNYIPKATVSVDTFSYINDITDIIEETDSTGENNVTSNSVNDENSTQPTTKNETNLKPTMSPMEGSYYYYVDNYETAQDFFNEITSIYVKSGNLERMIYKNNDKELIKEFCQCFVELLCIDKKAEQDRIDNANLDTIIIKDNNGVEKTYTYYRNYAIKNLSDSRSEYGVLTDDSVENLNSMIDKILLK